MRGRDEGMARDEEVRMRDRDPRKRSQGHRFEVGYCRGFIDVNASVARSG